MSRSGRLDAFKCWQVFEAIAIAGQARLKVIELSREDGLDDIGRVQMLVDLQRVADYSVNRGVGLSRADEPGNVRTWSMPGSRARAYSMYSTIPPRPVL
jgi:hypothetical protein